MKSFKNLIVWQKSMDAISELYKISRNFPKEEELVLINQIKRASISIPSNFAEGFGRQSTIEYKRFLKISRGSVYEIQTQLEIAFRLNYITIGSYKSLGNCFDEISKMLNGLINKLNN